MAPKAIEPIRTGITPNWRVRASGKARAAKAVKCTHSPPALGVAHQVARA